MKNKELNIDKTFRGKLEGFSVPPPPHVWDNIKGQMAGQRKKKRLAYFRWIAAAAVLVLAFLAGWYFNEKPEEIIPPAAENKVVQPGKNDTGTEDNLKVVIADPQKEIHIKINNQQQTGIETENKSFEKTPLTENSKPESIEPDNLILTSFERFRMKMLDRIDVLIRHPQPEILLATRTYRKTINSYSEVEKKLIAENVKTLGFLTKREANWKMGMYFSPGYSSNVANHSESYAQNMTYSGSDGNGNVGGGFSVQYKTGNRISVESGIYYAQNGQKSKNSFDLFAGKYDLALANGVAEEKSYFNTSVAVSNGHLAMNSTAGVIEFTGTPQGAEIAADLDARLDNSNVLLTDGEFSQVFDFIEIPLYLRYILIDSRVDLELLGGVSAGLVVGNNAFMENSYGRQNIGKTQDISTINFSGTVGIGVNYALGKHVSLAVEPRLNYYLNSINKNPGVNYRPYRIGVFTGVYYEF